MSPRAGTSEGNDDGAGLPQADPARRELDALFSAAYAELRRLASAIRRNDPAAATSPTTLVNQAWLKLAASPVAIVSEPQAPTHLNAGIARIKLGRALLSQGRYRDAEAETRAGCDLLVGQISPTFSWLVAAREDVTKIQAALSEPGAGEPER